MAEPIVPHFLNDLGVDTIRIGVKEFKCLGARPPHDHPHVYLDMGDQGEIVCPYCSTVFVYDPALGPADSDPIGCVADAAHFAPDGRGAAHGSPRAA